MKKTISKIAGGLMGAAAFTPLTALAQETTQSTPLGDVSSFGELVSVVWAYGSQVILALAVFFIILGAFFYVASAGSDEKISQGKQMITGAIAAIFIVLFSGVLIRLLHKPAEGSSGALADIPNVIGNAANILVGLIGAFSALMLAYAGILYIKGRGDAEELSKAHNAFRYAVVGLITGVLAYAITNTVINFLIA